ncbi:hypothetical protein [Sphingosinithalassobacter sp. LHW66-3]|uniref:hypothetical protein n=1 Tax=Sphingosinithalassobacter sp. LHW66-3 TaxID=3424718 RepID=UPI003D6A106D
MTRVLFWNIEQFSINKIFSASTQVTPGHGGLTDQVAAAQRKLVISHVLAATVPDIIVIIEVSSGENIAGALATPTGGLESVAMMQYYFNQHFLVPGGWNAVPPLYVGTGGRAETVGILYRRTNDAGTVRRYFTGPNVWTGGVGGMSVPPGPGVVPAAYTGLPLPIGTVNINGMLVPTGSGAARQIPAGALHNGGLHENLAAARVDFLDGTGAAIDFHGLRQPYMATFTEAVIATGVVQRNLTVFAVHSPPQDPAATNYIVGLAAMPDVVGALGANETRLIGGDFNVNLLADDGTASAAYNPLTGAPNNYRLLLRPTAAGVPTTLNQYRGYFSTHIRGRRTTAESEFFWSDPNAAQPSYYPGYGYVGSNFVDAPFYSIDNVLVWPFQGAPYDYRTTIMNIVTGTPFNGVLAPADGPPQGNVAMPSLFGAPPGGWPPAPNAANYPGIGAAGALTGWNNYKRIRNTSDHFGIFAEV